uniref:Insulin-like domain-containing protein n=1 Tax=Romanomermis culicivorax TaxID=13658 RepID=A0A915ID37_ROMCU
MLMEFADKTMVQEKITLKLAYKNQRKEIYKPISDSLLRLEEPTFNEHDHRNDVRALKTGKESIAKYSRSKMHLSEYFLVFIFVTVPLFVQQSYQSNPEDDISKYRQCGNELDKLITRICNGCIYGSGIPTKQKSSGHRVARDDAQINNNSNKIEENVGNHIRIKRYRYGLTAKCCFNYCSYNQMKAYCMEDCP